PRRVHPAGRQYCRTRWDPPGRHRATGGFEHRRTGGTAPPEPARATGLDALVRRAVRHRAARDRDRLAVPGRGLASLPAAAPEPARRLVLGPAQPGACSTWDGLTH